MLELYSKNDEFVLRGLERETGFRVRGKTARSARRTLQSVRNTTSCGAGRAHSRRSTAKRAASCSLQKSARHAAGLCAIPFGTEVSAPAAARGRLPPLVRRACRARKLGGPGRGRTGRGLQRRRWQARPTTALLTSTSRSTQSRLRSASQTHSASPKRLKARRGSGPQHLQPRRNDPGGSC